MTLHDSPAESARFGVRIARGESVTPLELAGSDAEVVILRVPSGEPLPVVPGWDTLDGGELVEWRVDPATAAVPAGRGLTTRESADASLISGLVTDVFRGYRTHYAVNPLLDDDRVAEGYAEWALAVVADGGIAVLLEDGDEPIGIAAVRRGGTWRIELAGITAGHRGRGAYAHLLRGIHDRARAAGARAVEIATQAENDVVQRAWGRAGYRPVRSFRTAHLVRSRPNRLSG